MSNFLMESRFDWYERLTLEGDGVQVLMDFKGSGTEPTDLALTDRQLRIRTDRPNLVRSDYVLCIITIINGINSCYKI